MKSFAFTGKKRAHFTGNMVSMLQHFQTISFEYFFFPFLPVDTTLGFNEKILDVQLY